MITVFDYETIETQKALNLESDILLKKDQIYKLMAEILEDVIKLKDDYGYSEEKLKELGRL